MFFDYMYYRIYHKYAVEWKDDMPMLYAICALVLCQSLNIILLWAFAAKFVVPNISLNKSGIIVAFILIFIINLRSYYIRKPYEQLTEIWKSESAEVRRKKGWFIVFYVLFSFPITVLILTMLN